MTQTQKSPDTVPPSGPLTAKIAIVGEAPGENEVREGVPFVGQSGQLLDQLLSNAGLARKDIYITNVIKERPKGNNISQFITFNAKTGEARPTAEYTVYESALYEELSRMPCLQVVVPMGNVALHALCRRTSITKNRGSILSPSAVGHTLGPLPPTVIPTLHPANALRTFINQYLILADLVRVREEIEAPRGPSSPKLYIRPTFEDITNYIERCLNTHRINRWPYVGFDIETIHCEGRWTVSCFSLALDANSAICVPFIDENGKHSWTEEEEVQIWALLCSILEHPSLTKVIHNAAFDCSFMLQELGMWTWPVYDTMVAQALCFPDFPKALGFMCSTLTRIPYYKDDGKMFQKWGGDVESFWRYNAMDSIAVMEALPELEKCIDKLRIRDVFENTVESLKSTIYMQLHGIRMDVEPLRQKSQDASIEEQILTERVSGMVLEKSKTLAAQESSLIARLTGQREDLKVLRKVLKRDYNTTKKGQPFDNIEYKQAKLDMNLAAKEIKKAETRLNGYLNANLSSPPQMQRYFYGVLGLRPLKHNGKITTNEKALTRLAINGCEEARLLGLHRKVAKLNSTYYTMKLDSDGRMRCSFSVVGATTLRLSSSKTIYGTGANMQNQPKVMKGFQLVDPNYIGFNVDLSQAENRIVAWAGPVPPMKAAFERGEDVHKLTAALIFGTSPDQISDVPGSCYLSGGRYSQRFWGKKMNHAGNYDIGAGELSFQLEIPQRDARWLLERYHNAYPEVRRNYQSMIRDMIYSGRTVINPFGKRRRYFASMREDAKDVLKSAYSEFAQSTVACLMSWYGMEYLYNAHPEAEMLCQIHDSVMFQVHMKHEDKVEGILSGLVQSLAKPIKLSGGDLVIPCDIECTNTDFLSMIGWDELKEIRV